MRRRIAILASGEGTTAESIIHACASGQVAGEVMLVITNKLDAGIIERIERLNQEFGLVIETLCVNAKTHPATAIEVVEPGGQTVAEEQAIFEALMEYHIELVLLMGYLRRVGPRLVAAYGWRPEYTSPYQARMLNTHPGLLPETKGFWGIHVQEHVLKAALPFGGQTLHVVADEYDEGPVVAEHQVAVEAGDTVDSLFERVKTIEKRYLPIDINNFISAQETFQAKKQE